MSSITKMGCLGLALGLSGCVAIVPAASASGARSDYTATRPVPGVAHTSMTVTASRTASTVAITSSNAKILADVAGQNLELECSSGGDMSATAPGVSTEDLNHAVWRKRSSSLRVTLPAPLLSGKSDCRTNVHADNGKGPPIVLSAAFQIAAPAPITVKRSAAAYLDSATSFRLDGSELTVTSANPAFLKTVQGRAVFGSCYSGVANIARWQRGDGARDKGRLVTVVGRQVRWAGGAHSATVTLPADISQDVDTCQFGAVSHIRIRGKTYDALPSVSASFDAAGAKFVAKVRASQVAAR